MPFKRLPDNQGMIYIPDHRKVEKKRPCPDCFACNWCSDDRCLTCRSKCGQEVKKDIKKVDPDR